MKTYYQCTYCAGTNAVILGINMYWDYEAQTWKESEIDTTGVECMDCGGAMEERESE